MEKDPEHKCDQGPTTEPISLICEMRSPLLAPLHWAIVRCRWENRHKSDLLERDRRTH